MDSRINSGMTWKNIRFRQDRWFAPRHVLCITAAFHMADVQACVNAAPVLAHHPAMRGSAPRSGKHAAKFAKLQRHRGKKVTPSVKFN